MVYSFSTNNAAAMTTPQASFILKTLLKSIGWTIPSSSDGTTYNATGDQIISGGSGPGGWANNNAWARFRAPDGYREFTMQRGTTNVVWRMKYSYFERFEVGAPAATVTPGATDERIFLGGGTDAAPTFVGWTGTDSDWRLQCAANNTDGYGFYMIASDPMTAGSGLGPNIIWDPLMPGSYPAADVDPMVISTAFPYINNGIVAAGLGSFGFLKKGLAGEGFVNIPMIGSAIGGPAFFPNFIGAGADGYDVSFPVMYGRNTALVAPNGYKGLSGMIKWNGNSTAANGSDNIRLISEVTTNDRICIGDVNLPWNGFEIIR